MDQKTGIIVLVSKIANPRRCTDYKPITKEKILVQMIKARLHSVSQDKLEKENYTISKDENIVDIITLKEKVRGVIVEENILLLIFSNPHVMDNSEMFSGFQEISGLTANGRKIHVLLLGGKNSKDRCKKAFDEMGGRDTFNRVANIFTIGTSPTGRESSNNKEYPKKFYKRKSILIYGIRRVQVWEEKVFRGRKYPNPIKIFLASYKKDYRLVPKDEEEVYAKETEKYLTLILGV
ncbi:hypothetical protein J437_LFUL008017 [Ladona fulva]|uniref:Uncharacterized protein n=1 Tax=Ladona fulva TaxID=123851 RepID=A0A8K0P5G7_LADFU|nr:hypothetical protein J437_LFUL008017 [Ladona fulva]